MKKLLKILDEHAEDVLAVILMSAATLIIVIQVIMRYLFKNSLSWSEEMARYLFVWMTFISISYGIKMRKHVKIEAALSLFPKSIRPLVVIIGDIFSLVWCVFVTVVGFNLIGKVVRCKVRSDLTSFICSDVADISCSMYWICTLNNQMYSDNCIES